MLIVKFTVRMLQSCINLISDKIKNSLNVPETFRIQLIAEGFCLCYRKITQKNKG